MSVSFNNRITFGDNNDHQNRSIIGTALKLGVATGAGALGGMAVSAQGALDLPKDKLDLKNVNKKLQDTGENALKGFQLKTARKAKSFLERAEKLEADAKGQAPEIINEAKTNAEKLTKKAKEFMTKGVKPVREGAAIGAAVGIGLLALGSIFRGKEESHAAESLKPIS